MRVRVLAVGAALALAACAWVGAAGAMPSIGVEVGLNESRLPLSPDLIGLNTGFRPAWSLGLVADQPLPRRLSLHTGVRYVEYGDVLELRFSGSDAYGGVLVARFRAHTVWRYAAVPALLRWRPLAGHGPFIEAGPEAGFLLQVRQFSTSSFSDAYVPNPQGAIGSQIFEQVGTFGSRDDVTSSYRRWNVAVAGGAGYEARVAGHRLVVEARYTHGLTNLLKTSEVRRATRGLEAIAGFGW